MGAWTSASRRAFLCLWAAGLAVPAAAQVRSGEIFGKVLDESGAVVAGARVDLSGDALIRPLAAVSERNGAYRFPGLPPGVYTVSFEMAGFGRLVREGIRVETGFNAEVNARLKVGGLREAMTVSGAAPP